MYPSFLYRFSYLPHTTLLIVSHWIRFCNESPLHRTGERENRGQNRTFRFPNEMKPRFIDLHNIEIFKMVEATTRDNLERVYS